MHLHHDSVATLIANITNFSEKPNEIYPNCAEAMAQNKGLNGVYTLSRTRTLTKAFKVFCRKDENKTNSAPWLVIQRRINGDVDFYRSWQDYKLGFGNMETEFWLGLEHIHSLTSEEPYELKIIIKFIISQKLFVFKHSHFVIAAESDKYRLTSLGKLSGDVEQDAGLNNQLNQPFSTFDKDNDKSCAKKNHGAWWYADCRYRYIDL